MENKTLLVLLDGYLPRDMLMQEDAAKEGIYMVEVDARLPEPLAVAAAVDGFLAEHTLVEPENFSLSVHDSETGAQVFTKEEYQRHANTRYCRRVQRVSAQTALKYATYAVSRRVQSLH